MIAIIDYGMGNTGSLQNMIRKVGGSSIITADHSEFEKADKLILPGVGSFDNGIKNLESKGLSTLLTNLVLHNKKPILCICLGMQLITKSSEEGSLSGLGWINAKTIKFNFPDEPKLRIPHMGWNTVSLKKSSSLFLNMYDDPCFYFVHSFHLVCADQTDILTTTSYGYEFTSAIQKENIYATQYHPEKSHKHGLLLIKNFVEL
jgi:glutamine amidotransferase